MKIHFVAVVLLSLTAILGILRQAQAASPVETAKASLDNYVQAWHEADAAKRAELLETAWAENGTYTDPGADVAGREALVEHIGGFLSNPQFKGFKIVRTSEIDFHHHTFRFEWAMQNPAGQDIMNGMDFGEFNDDGVITKIVGFFGPFPALK